MSTLQIVFVSIAACLLVFWTLIALTSGRRGSDGVVLRYGSVLRVLALILAWAPPCVAIYVIWNYTWRTENLLITAGVGFLATSLIAGLLLIEVERTQVHANDEGITRRSPWTGRAFMKWSEVRAVEYSRLNRWIVLIGTDKKFRVSRYLDGFAAFAKLLRNKIATEHLAGAKACLDAYS